MLRWQFPLWIPELSLDPADLKAARPRRQRKRDEAREQSQEPDWTPERFAEEFVGEEPELKLDITEKAREQGLTARKAGILLRKAEDADLVYRWKFGSNVPVNAESAPIRGADRDDACRGGGGV